MFNIITLLPDADCGCRSHQREPSVQFQMRMRPTVRRYTCLSTHVLPPPKIPSRLPFLRRPCRLCTIILKTCNQAQHQIDSSHSPQQKEKHNNATLHAQHHSRLRTSTLNDVTYIHVCDNYQTKCLPKHAYKNNQYIPTHSRRSLMHACPTVTVDTTSFPPPRPAFQPKIFRGTHAYSC